jgi:hypothetical protein
VGCTGAIVGSGAGVGISSEPGVGRTQAANKMAKPSKIRDILYAENRFFINFSLLSPCRYLQYSTLFHYEM